MTKRTEAAAQADLIDQAAPSAESTGGAIAERPESALAIPAEELAADAGAGYEEERAEDVQIPTLVILQALSPQLDPAKAAFLPEAKLGMICDTLTGRLFDGAVGVEVVSVHFRPMVNLLKITPSGGGEFVEAYEITDPKAGQPTSRDDRNRDVLVSAPGFFLQSVALHFVMLRETGEFYLVRMRRTQIRPSKRWNSLLRAYAPLVVNGAKTPRPRFGMVSRLKVVREERDGKSWGNWSPEIVGLLTDGPLADVAAYREAKRFHRLIAEGRVVVRPESDELEEPADEAVPF